jgi:hypothetical protein
MYNASLGHRLSWPIKKHLIKKPAKMIKKSERGTVFLIFNILYFPEFLKSFSSPKSRTLAMI